MDETIRYRPRARRLPWPILVAPAAFFASALLDKPRRAVTVAGALVVLMGVALRWLSRTGVTLRPDARLLGRAPRRDLAAAGRPVARYLSRLRAMTTRWIWFVPS